MTRFHLRYLLSLWNHSLGQPSREKSIFVVSNSVLSMCLRRFCTFEILQRGAMRMYLPSIEILRSHVRRYIGPIDCDQYRSYGNSQSFDTALINVLDLWLPSNLFQSEICCSVRGSIVMLPTPKIGLWILSSSSRSFL